MEHAAHLAVVRSLWAGMAYLLGSVLVGTAVYWAAHRCGKRWRVFRKAVDWATHGPLCLIPSGMERCTMLMAVTMAACGGWMAGHALEKLCWGIAMATAGGVIGNWFSSLKIEGGAESSVNWGNWRCNTLAFACVVTACRYVASLEEPRDREAILESAFFTALIGPGFGTISGFANLTVDVGDLLMAGDYQGAAATMFLNLATAAVALLARMKAEMVLLGKRHLV